MRDRRYLRWGALLLALAMLLPGMPGGVRAAEGGMGYVLRGVRQGEAYRLDVNITGATGLGGRFALTYDTSKVALEGGDSFTALRAAPGVSLTGDYVAESELVNGEAGSVGFAWYSYGLNATEGEATVVSLTFRVLDGDFDAGTFRPRYIGEDFGTWTSPLSLQGKSPGVAPDSYTYLAERGGELTLSFAYDGWEREPEAGRAVTLACRDLTGAAVPAVLELGGRTYITDSEGDIPLRLLDGRYDYRLTAEGYGPRRGVLTVSGDSREEITFFTDQMLVEEARDGLEIGYHEGEGPQTVRTAVQLPARTESGVDVAWASSAPNVMTPTGLVFRPEADTPLTLTATLTRGTARTEKSFDLVVLEKDREPPAEPDGPSGHTSGGKREEPRETRPEPLFTDLEAVPWAADAIEALGRAGVIQGVGAGSFAPLDDVRRCDFLLLVMRLVGAEAGEAAAAEFDDVRPGDYYYDAITAARSMGLAEGDGGNRFHPTAPITRQEMLTITARALDRTGYAPLPERAGSLTAYGDGAAVAPWAAQAVGRAVAAGYIVGNGAGLLTPEAHTTRAEAAVFLYRLYAAHGQQGG